MDLLNNEYQKLSNRSFPYPREPWIGYQEWHDTIFLHYKTPFEVIRSVVPHELEIDIFMGDCYISVVPFTVKNLRPRLIPAFKPISEFYELNLRTYVKYNGIPGIYFFSLEASKILPVIAARVSTRLPYLKSDIWRDNGMYNSYCKSHGFNFHLEYSISGQTERNEKISWLSDRFRLYVKSSGIISMIDVDHIPWELQDIEIRELKLNYMITQWPLSKLSPEIANFSRKVEVKTWRRMKA